PRRLDAQGHDRLPGPPRRPAPALPGPGRSAGAPGFLQLLTGAARLLHFLYTAIRRITIRMAILTQAMRRFFPLVLVMALLLPGAAWAASDSSGSSVASGDGTLVVDNGNGSVIVRARGGILGRFDNG